jgi:hypothetical protein
MALEAGSIAIVNNANVVHLARQRTTRLHVAGSHKSQVMAVAQASFSRQLVAAINGAGLWCHGLPYGPPGVDSARSQNPTVVRLAELLARVGESVAALDCAMLTGHCTPPTPRSGEATTVLLLQAQGRLKLWMGGCGGWTC